MRQTNQEDQEKGGNGKVGAKGKDLLHFAGLIEEDDLRLMEEAIERDCEKVALDEW